MKRCRLLLFFLMLSTPLYAEIVLDHSLSPNIFLSNEITEDVGLRLGNNLFHSFESFNLQQNEIVTFSGAANIENIITRVTGGKPSFIDGTIRSTIPNADFYLLNPAGLRFGAQARLDIQGSFYASTAHYLTFADGGRFDAQNPQDTILTTAPVSAFGFIQAATPIELRGYGELTADTELTTGLSVPKGKNLSLIGGEINILQGSFFYDVSTNSRGQTSSTTQRLPSLSISAGRINLIATQGRGEVNLDTLNLSQFAQLADVNIQQQSQINVNDGGQIFIRAEQFVLEDSVLQAKTAQIGGGKIDIAAKHIALTQGSQISTQTTGDGNGAEINLRAAQQFTISGKNADNSRLYPLDSETSGAGHGGNIQVQANSINIDSNDLEASATASGQGGDIKLNAQQTVKLNNVIIYVNAYSQESNAGDSGNLFIEAENIEISGGMINVGVFGSGRGGNIELKATEDINLIENVHLFSDAYLGRGDGGDTILEANHITLKDGAFIDTTAKNAGGNAGRTILKATGAVTISGVSQEGKGRASSLKSGSINLSKDVSSGKGGLIQIEAASLYLMDGGLVSNSSDSPKWGQSSDAGQIIIRVSGETKLSGVNEFGENREGFGSGIYARTIGVGNNTGSSGSIDLQTGTLIIEKGGVIESNTNISEKGGDINILVQGDIHISGNAAGLVTEKAGNTQLRYLSEFSPKVYNESTSGIYARTTGSDGYAGQGGAINITANQLTLENQGQISTSTTGDGEAGNISLNLNKLVMDNSGLITSDSQATNRYTYANAIERSEKMLMTGDVVKVLDSAGRIAYYAHNGDNLTRINYIHSVPDMETLKNLTENYLISNGDIIKVEETGQRYVYADLYGVFQSWIAFDESGGNDVVEFETIEELFFKTDGWYDGVERLMPYPYGTVMRVKDAGGGKPATFIYSGLLDPINNFYIVGPTRLLHYEANTMAQLQALSQQQALLDGTIGVLNQNQQFDYFIYRDGQWLDLSDTETHTVQNLAEQNKFVVAHTGYISTLTDRGVSEIYDGQQWIPLNQNYRVSDLAQRDSLSAQTGDVVLVENIGKSYLYRDGQWLQQITGGDAGLLQLNIRDGLYLSDGSQITTESTSAGGGGIQINTRGSLFLKNAQISTSVQEGAGNGGNLDITEPQFLTLNRSSIRAQAYQGNGGNIFIIADEFIQSADSIISASSDLGIDGHVDVTSPDETISRGLALLSKDFLQQINISDPCEQIRQAQASIGVEIPFTLKVNFYRHINDSLDNWQPHLATSSMMPQTFSCEAE